MFENEDWDCVEVKDTGPGGADGKDWLGPAVCWDEALKEECGVFGRELLGTAVAEEGNPARGPTSRFP